MLSRMQIENPEEIEAQERLRRAQAAQKMNFQHSQAQNSGADPAADPAAEQRAGNPKVETFVREQPKVGRNDPCPCGSGKKYKQCHGRL